MTQYPPKSKICEGPVYTKFINSSFISHSSAILSVSEENACRRIWGYRDGRRGIIPFVYSRSAAPSEARVQLLCADDDDMMANANRLRAGGEKTLRLPTKKKGGKKCLPAKMHYFPAFILHIPDHFRVTRTKEDARKTTSSCQRSLPALFRTTTVARRWFDRGPSPLLSSVFTGFLVHSTSLSR